MNYIYNIHKYIINSYFDSAHLQSYFKKNSNWNLQIRFPSIKCIKKPQNLEQRNFCQNPIIFFPSWMKDTIKGIYFCMPIVFRHLPPLSLTFLLVLDFKKVSPTTCDENSHHCWSMIILVVRSLLKPTLNAQPHFLQKCPYVGVVNLMIYPVVQNWLSCRGVGDFAVYLEIAKIRLCVQVETFLENL